MTEKDLRERIKQVAVEHFNTNGFYGTTIRNIAEDVNCSLPMIYYYFKNKKELFDEIIKKEYPKVIEKQASQLKLDNAVDFYTEFIYNLNSLSKYDKQVYRLGIKVYLAFDGDEELISHMNEWEMGIIPRHREMLKPYLKDVQQESAIVRTLIHVLEIMIENIVVRDCFLPEEQIREEIAIVLQNGK